MRKWMNFETCFRSLKDNLRAFLKENEIQYELSDCSWSTYKAWHFEVYCNKEEAEKINDWLDTQTITEEV